MCGCVHMMFAIMSKEEEDGGGRRAAINKSTYVGDTRWIQKKSKCIKLRIIKFVVRRVLRAVFCVSLEGFASCQMSLGGD